MPRMIWTLKDTDKRFSLWIKERDKYKCARCGKVYEKGSRNLTNSHFWARQHKGTRFDPLNCDSACWKPCHKYYWEKEKQGDYRDFKMKQLGKKEYALMEKRARGVYPQDKAIIDCMKLLGEL